MKLLLSILFCIFATVESRPVRLHGLNYNTRQGPDWMPYDQRCKSRKQVWTDLSLLHKITDRVRLLSISCLLYTSPSPRDGLLSRMPSSA